MDGVDSEHGEAVVGRAAPLHRHAAGHRVSAAVQTRVDGVVVGDEGDAVRRRVGIVLPARRLQVA